MPTTPRRFFHIKTCTHGAVAVNTVQSITYRKGFTRLAGQGDNDLGDSFQAKVNLQISGTIVLQDPIQADALLDAAEADLTWNGETAAGGTEKTMLVQNVAFFSLDETDAHNALDGVTLGWNGVLEAGADPASAALAV
jgi:hypothetical protein